MLELNPPHLDDFTLLRYVAEDLDDAEHDAAANHLRICEICRETFDEIQQLDKELRAIAANPNARRDLELEGLPRGDPFSDRPDFAARIRRRAEVSGIAVTAVAASEDAMSLGPVILKAVAGSLQEQDEALSRLSLSEACDRFALLYALQQAGLEIADNPAGVRSFAEAVLRMALDNASTGSEADSVVPTAVLIGQAHLVAGHGCIWNSDFDRAGVHFELAHRAFSTTRDQMGLAKCDLLEAQRRYFVGKGQEALFLSRRAAATFDFLGLDADRARARQAEGLALYVLERMSEAAEAFRESCVVFERHSLWSNYVSAVNSFATALMRLGRLPEARREYAKALRKISGDRNKSWLPLLRKGLAEVLFAAGRYREAAIAAGQAARLWKETGLPGRSLMVSLFEAESWARAADITRARHRLELFRSEVARQGVLDAALSQLIDQALSGASSDFQEIAQLRRAAESTLRERFGAIA